MEGWEDGGFVRMDVALDTYPVIPPELSGGFKYFLFSPLFGEDYHFDEDSFQRGWFNHQLVRHVLVLIYDVLGVKMLNVRRCFWMFFWVL